jgi:hypothetical protein
LEGWSRRILGYNDEILSKNQHTITLNLRIGTLSRSFVHKNRNEGLGCHTVCLYVGHPQCTPHNFPTHYNNVSRPGSHAVSSHSYPDKTVPVICHFLSGPLCGSGSSEERPPVPWASYIRHRKFCSSKISILPVCKAAGHSVVYT